MWIAIVNNLPELALGLAWTGLVFWQGRRFEKDGFAAFLPRFTKPRS